MIADMLNNKNLNPIVTELFIRDRKLNISFVFITQSYFAVPKDIRLNSTHFFFSWKFQINENFNKLDLIVRQILTLKTFCIFKKNVLQNYIISLVIDATFASDNFHISRRNF